ncbi:MAG: hypothetical protein ACYCPQ_00440 [Elusimicrobiota bacterium]
MENSELIGTLQRDPSQLTDHELLYLDHAIHSAWQHECGGQAGIPFAPCSIDHLVELHAIIKRQMDLRGFRHLIADKLDARTSLLEQQRRSTVGFFRGAQG